MRDMLINDNILPPVLSIIAAQSNTGKTTLIEGLIHYLKKRKYRIGVIKHDAHRFEIDKKGKDSYRFSHAGADTVVLSSAEKLAMIKNLDYNMDLETILPLFSDTDIVIIEGYKENAFSKIEVFREKVGGNLLYHTTGFSKENILAVASDVSLDLPIPVLDLNCIETIGTFIEEQILKGRS